MKNQKGITLISLIVTIIVLIILAGISLNMLIREDSIVSKAKQQQIIQTKAEILQELELAKGPIMIKGEGYTDLNKYVEFIEKDGLNSHKVKVEEGENENTKILIVDNEYLYTAAQIKKDVIINEIGHVSEIKPIIDYFVVKKSSTSTITVSVSAKLAKDYSFYIAKEGEEYKLDGSLKTSNNSIKYESELKEYTYSGLVGGETYNLKVVVSNKNGERDQAIKYTVGTVPELTPSNINVTLNPSGWTNQNVTATVEVSKEIDMTDLTLQTSKDGESWSNTSSQEYSTNGVIYAKLINSKGQEGAGTTSNINNIDKINPVVTSAIANTNEITIHATDEASGIIGYAVTENDTIPTEFIGCANTTMLNTTISNMQQGKTYYVWVKDEAGNISTYKQVGTGTIPDLTESDITVTLNPSGWTNQNVTATVKVNEKIDTTGLTLQTSKDGITWDNATSQTYNTNGVIYARLIDTTQQEGASTTSNINNIDKTNPIITSATVNTNTITIQATDEASGIVGYTVTENDTMPTDFTSCTNTMILNTIINNKQQGKTYYIWVKDEAGNISSYKQVETENVPDLTQSDITVRLEPSGWTNQKVTATVEINTAIDTTGLTLQTSQNGKDWDNTASQIFSTNGVIYAKLVDDIGQEGASTTSNISNIDKTNPNVTITEGKVTSNSIQVNITASDDESGLVTSGTYKYYINDEEKPRATNESNSYLYTGLSAAIPYKIKVEVTDNAGNVGVATKEISTSSNEVPTVPTVTLQSKTPSVLNFQATSTDENNDSLTYKLYMRPKDTGEYTVKDTKTANSGTAVTLSATSLANYTEYDYYVEVTDNKDEPINTANAVERTQCSGTTQYCSTGYPGQQCPGGTKCKCKKTIDYFPGDPSQGYCACTHRGSQHGYSGCEAYKACQHGYTSSHMYGQRYCPHGRTSAHYCCEHNGNGVAHN